MAAAKKKKIESASGWSPRLAGVLLCAFFALGMITGFSEAGRRVAARARDLFATFTDRTLAKLGPLRHRADRIEQSVAPLEVLLKLKRSEVPATRPDADYLARAHDVDDPIAIVERHDGFYALLARGEIRGPVSPAQQPNLAIISGAGVESAKGPDMLSDAAILVRAEAQMSSLISEMRIDDDGTASFFLDRERMAVVVDLDRAQVELPRALDVLKQWQGRERLIAMLDMTTPDMAVVRLKTELPVLKKPPVTIARIRPARATRVSIADRGRVLR